ncbi:MAG: hypothetical protein K2M17_00860 [Bacilli bacterium]|nr:hypothetical protein [Bacilli bacterium]
MTPEVLLREMTYENDAQMEEAKRYIALKGIVQYQRVIEFCRSQDETPTYTQVSSMYRYDKRLRDNLYIYLATAEEFMRTCIGNRFEDNESGLVKTKKFIAKQSQYHSVSLTLEQLTLGALIEMVLNNRGVFVNHYDLSNIQTNLNALRVLRNKVGHHNFLFVETYANCIVNGAVGNSLEQNIKNLQSFLPSDFKRGFATKINNCANDLEINQIIEIKDGTNE